MRNPEYDEEYMLLWSNVKYRDIIKRLLLECRESEQNMFKKMYALKDENRKNPLSIDINIVVDEMQKDKLRNAYNQILKTIERRFNPKFEDL